MRILSLNINHLSFRESIARVMELAMARTPSYVCFANVHMTIEAYKDSSFQAQVSNASLVLADGMPLATACYSLYRKKQERISGMDFMPAALEAADKEGASIFLYGSSSETLEALQYKIRKAYPSIRMAGAISPPFRQLKPAELQEHIDQINHSGANLVFVSLGCPKQEKWMAANYKKIDAVLLGVGGAFPVVAGIRRRSPKWMQNSGLEWFHRLLMEPRRMFRRYWETNFLFLYLMGREKMRRTAK